MIVILAILYFIHVYILCFLIQAKAGSVTEEPDHGLEEHCERSNSDVQVLKLVLQKLNLAHHGSPS